MRRSLQELQWLFNKRQSWRISDADGPGFLYAYVNNNKWKISTMNNFTCRQKQQDKSCPDISRLWLPPIKVANQQRAGEFCIYCPLLLPICVTESLAHLMLELASIDQLRTYCHLCTCLNTLLSTSILYLLNRSEKTRWKIFFTQSLPVIWTTVIEPIMLTVAIAWRYAIFLLPKRFIANTTEVSVDNTVPILISCLYIKN